MAGGAGRGHQPPHKIRARGIGQAHGQLGCLSGTGSTFAGMHVGTFYRSLGVRSSQFCRRLCSAPSACEVHSVGESLRVYNIEKNRRRLRAERLRSSRRVWSVGESPVEQLEERPACVKMRACAG